MRQLEKGDKVRVIASGFEHGMKGTVVSVKGVYCQVYITQAGTSHNTVQYIGTTRRYKVTDVGII